MWYRDGNRKKKKKKEKSWLHSHILKVLVRGVDVIPRGGDTHPKGHPGRWSASDTFLLREELAGNRSMLSTSTTLAWMHRSWRSTSRRGPAAQVGD